MKHRQCDYCDRRLGWWGHYYCPQNYRVLKSFTYKSQPKKEKPVVHRWKVDKCSTRGGFYGRSAKKNWKFFTKRKHRAWERQMLQQEKYDEFHRRSYKNADDWWSWD